MHALQAEKEFERLTAMSSKLLVTAALPYANGPIHLGHLVEYIQADIYVRATRMLGRNTLFICGADSHGTAIEINAHKAHIAPDTFIAQWQSAHSATFERFGIRFDGGYGSTHTALNEHYAQSIFMALKSKGLVEVRDVEQFYDPQEGRFLADRQIRGTCPKCKAEDQYGDSCEKCGSTYRPTDLINPKSALSGANLELRSSQHYFVQVSHYAKAIQEWITKPGVVQQDVQNYLQSWLAEGLKDWDVSRDGPYFGFRIPGETDKYFYVWLDAPIGYISMAEKAALERGETLADYWQNPNCQIVHFIGKDIVYFHTLFWPAMLMAAGYQLPSVVAVHGMLTINGEKMSKSRGTFVLADVFAEHLDPQALRYYFACKLTPHVEDLDLNFDDFSARVNADIVNKVANLLSRTVPLLHRYFNGFCGDIDSTANEMFQEVSLAVQNVERAYLARDTALVTREIVSIAEQANKYLQDNAPWDTVKTDPVKAHQQLTTALWVGKVCVGLLKPILPNMAEQTEAMLQLTHAFTFETLLDELTKDTAIKPYPRLFERIDKTGISAVLNASIQSTPTSPKLTKEASMTKSESISNNLIAIDDFIKVDLRAAKVLTAKPVDGADKLISIELDVGDLGHRHVFAGLRPHVEPAQLVGQTVCLVANLAPRKMRFGISEGMILACGSNPPVPVYLNDSKPGDKLG